MHRVLMQPKKGEWVDHKNHNGLNNQRHNLRIATPSQNNSNTRLKKTNTSGFKGVREMRDRPRPNRFSARIQVNGKQIHIGLYFTPEEAFEAYKKAAIKYHGEFAKW